MSGLNIPTMEGVWNVEAGIFHPFFRAWLDSTTQKWRLAEMQVRRPTTYVDLEAEVVFLSLLGARPSTVADLEDGCPFADDLASLSE